jgi:S-formylglutathione hydrolase
MGGHGALMIGLKNPELFTSISAFSPIVNPMACPWGQKALGGYLGDDQQGWAQYDSCELIKGGAKHANRILVDQGTSDEFLAEQLLSDNLVNVCKESEQELELNFREDYDHSYYFISSFIEDHIKFHLSNF